MGGQLIDAPDAAQIPWTPAAPPQAATETELREILHAALRVANERRILPPDALRRMWRGAAFSRDWKLRRTIALVITHLYDAAQEERLALEARMAARATASGARR